MRYSVIDWLVYYMNLRAGPSPTGLLNQRGGSMLPLIIERCLGPGVADSDHHTTAAMFDCRY